jgi:hypothetical protein
MSLHKGLLSVAAVLLGLAASRRSYADLLTTSGDDYSTSSSSGAWPTNPAPHPSSVQEYDSLTPSGAPSSATTAQAMPTVSTSPGASGYCVLAETINPTTTFTLTDIDIVASGGGGATDDMILRLFPLTSEPNGQSGSSAYNLSNESSTDLLGGGSGLAFTFNGFSGQKVVDFSLTTAPNGQTAGDDTVNDQITLTAGNSYALEFWNAQNSTFYWGRTGANASADGELFGATDANVTVTRTTTANLGLTSGPRPGAVELYGVVPEPASLFALAIAAAMGLLRGRRVRQAQYGRRHVPRKYSERCTRPRV